MSQICIDSHYIHGYNTAFDIQLLLFGSQCHDRKNIGFRPVSNLPQKRRECAEGHPFHFYSSPQPALLRSAPNSSTKGLGMSAVVITVNIKIYIIFKFSTAAEPASHLEGLDGRQIIQMAECYVLAIATTRSQSRRSTATITFSRDNKPKSVRSKRKLRNHRPPATQNRYYVSTRRYSGRRTFDLRSSCCDRKNIAFCHLDDCRPSDRPSVRLGGPC
jgi:hypothetical protein